jgi:hypothetical protein
MMHETPTLRLGFLRRKVLMPEGLRVLTCCAVCHAPGGTRIPNLLIRSQMLYPIELQARKESIF